MPGRPVSHGAGGVRARRLGGDRAGETRFTRFLRNASLSPSDMTATAFARTQAGCAGRDTLCRSPRRKPAQRRNAGALRRRRTFGSTASADHAAGRDGGGCARQRRALRQTLVNRRAVAHHEAQGYRHRGLQVTDAGPRNRLILACSIAATVVMQRMAERDGPALRLLTSAFDASDRPSACRDQPPPRRQDRPAEDPPSSRIPRLRQPVLRPDKPWCSKREAMCEADRPAARTLWRASWVSTAPNTGSPIG